VDERLARLAARCGILHGYHDIWGKWHPLGEDTARALLQAMGVSPEDPASCPATTPLLAPATVVRADSHPLRIALGALPPDCPPRLDWTLATEDGAEFTGALATHEARELVLETPPPYGYHDLTITGDGRALARTRLIVAPLRCYRPPALEGERRVWGTTVQLYALRSARNFGMGDFTDLRSVVETWGEAGAALFGVNPLHALFPHDPRRISPYSPSSRLYRNVLYLDVEAMADFAECAAARERLASGEFQQRLAALRATELVDYPGVAAAKFELLELLYASFRRRHLASGSARADAFRRYQAREGWHLRRHALFEALQARFHAQAPSVWGWQVWPAAFRDPGSEAVRAFEAEALERVEYYEYLQWQVDLQLAALAARAAELGCGIGLYEDLAVSIDRAGAEAWSAQAVYATGASVGAPPDAFSPLGQDWGLPPLNPVALAASAYEPFIATLRANMRHAGALRIDHVMALMRLYWVPLGAPASEGAYVRYPLEDLLAVLALESVRNECLVIGEDLGTVPDELRHALHAAGVLSYRLLYFERDPQGSFKAPGDFEREALVAPTTHDLPTLAGWWKGRDIAWRAELGLYADDAAREGQFVERAQDRARLLLALQHAGLLPAGVEVDPLGVPELTPELVRAVFALLATTPARALVAPLDDVIGMIEQTNLPGTTDQHPNWQRKLARPVEALRADEHFRLLAAELVRVRGRCHGPPPRSAATRIPRATYRLQMHRGFTFDDATAIVPYLATLGVSHAYCSPLLRARAGSQHGYDIVDHGMLNPEIGDEAAFERFVGALKGHGMGLMLDLVPNHMAVMGADNAWWADVLEHGRASSYAGYFDIRWRPPGETPVDRLLVPVLGDHYGRVLEAGELVLAFERPGAAFAVRYYEHRFPIDPREYPRILGPAVARLAPGALPDAERDELASLIDAFAALPPREADGEQAARRRRDAVVLRGRLATLAERHPAVVAAIEEAVATTNGTPGERTSFDALDALLEAQAYRLANWRTAADEINYRRFFEVNDLAALRMEEPEVFEATHRFVLDLAASGKVDALRIDHSDGLYDPGGYFARLQSEYAARVAARGGTLPDDARPIYLVAEKIAAPHESLPVEWPLHGTTGYRFANLANGLFIAPQARGRLDRLWRAFAGPEAEPFEELAYRGKWAVMAGPLASELAAQAQALLRLARADRRTRDFTLNTLSRALAEVVACLPVYRTYVTTQPTAQDRRYIDWAVAQGRRRARDGEASIFEFVHAVLLVCPPEDAPDTVAAAWREFVRRFQQFTGAVTAKGIEDTAFYRYNRLVSLNEVGGSPDQFGIGVSAFHGANTARAANWPHGLLASSTHDTKRAEDVRCRIDVLSEMPKAWRAAVRRWTLFNRSRRRRIDDTAAPSGNDEYLFYQTLVGTFPVEPPDEDGWAAYRERLSGYMLKALREAKRHTSWIDPAEDYEAAVNEFVETVLAAPEGNLFIDDVAALARNMAWFGAWNSVSLALLKLASPGVPDLYQGTELLDFSLVDPDNRRPVDFPLREATLGALQRAGDAAETLAGLANAVCDGRLKLWVTWRALQLRRRRPEVFRDGDYLAVEARGERADHVAAFARRAGNRGVIAAAGRLFASLGLEPGTPPVGAQAWRDTRIDTGWLPAGTLLRDAVSGTERAAGDELALAELFATAPVALLEYETP